MRAIQFDVIVYVNRDGKRVIQNMHISRQRVDYDDANNNDDNDNADNIKRRKHQHEYFHFI